MTRVVTAIVFVAVVVGSIYGGQLSFMAFFALICGLSLWEFFGLTNKGENVLFRRMFGTLIGLSPYLGFSYLQLTKNSGFQFESIAFITLGIILLFFLQFLYELFKASSQPFLHLSSTALALLYIGIPFALFQFLAFWPSGGSYDPNKILGLLLLVWSNDTFAYLVGSQIGKTKLFPRISPKKTWEGSIGGGVLTLVIAYACFMVLGGYSLQDWMVLGLLAVVFGGLGDLVESMMKRSLNIKDSGGILPGHGGILDRFDAFIFFLPFATFYLIIVEF